VPLTASPFGSVNSPEPKPWIRGFSSNGPPPRTASRSRSLNVPIPVPAMFAWVAWVNRASPATSPKSQPSP
jgi:hypothetical protein